MTFLFTYHSCPYRFPYIDSTLINTFTARARTLLTSLRSNIVPTKMTADQLCAMNFPRCLFQCIYSSVDPFHKLVLRS